MADGVSDGHLMQCGILFGRGALGEDSGVNRQDGQAEKEAVNQSV